MQILVQYSYIKKLENKHAKIILCAVISDATIRLNQRVVYAHIKLVDERHAYQFVRTSLCLTLQNEKKTKNLNDNKN